MGRRRGLKIPRGAAPCEFESRLRHHRSPPVKTCPPWILPLAGPPVIWLRPWVTDSIRGSEATLSCSGFFFPRKKRLSSAKRQYQGCPVHLAGKPPFRQLGRGEDLEPLCHTRASPSKPGLLFHREPKGAEGPGRRNSRRKKTGVAGLPPLDFPGSPGRTRTADQVVNSHPLYLLSYRGSQGGRRTGGPGPTAVFNLAGQLQKCKPFPPRAAKPHPGKFRPRMVVPGSGL